MSKTPEERLDQLFLAAFETNEAAMLDWVQIKFRLKAARTLETQRDEANRLLEDLCALVLGECPRLLDETRGGDAKLFAQITNHLKP